MTLRSFFRLDIEPMSTPRPRARVVAVGSAKPKTASQRVQAKSKKPTVTARVYNQAKYTNWKSMLTMLVRHRAKHHFGKQQLTVSMDIAMTKARTSKLKAPSEDADNLAKGPLDAITQSAAVWLDDKQVQRLVIEKRFAGRGEEAHIDVSVEAWAPREQRAEHIVYEALWQLDPAARKRLVAELLVHLHSEA